MLVNVIGMGYIGLPTALMMAAHDVNVIGTDYNSELIKQLPKKASHHGTPFRNQKLFLKNSLLHGTPGSQKSI